ncbi:MAG: hypothetical protein ACI9LM_002966 [Alteromonadaceae bacterium]|jgi:hypothetical protein
MSLSVNAAEQVSIKNNAEVSIQYNTAQLEKQLNNQLINEIKQSISKVRMTEYIEASVLTARRDVNLKKNTPQKSEDE